VCARSVRKEDTCVCARSVREEDGDECINLLVCVCGERTVAIERCVCMAGADTLKKEENQKRRWTWGSREARSSIDAVRYSMTP
jgi:hypothetical protein